MARNRFPYYAWGLLAYNLAVVLGGAFVRATQSGDGCGNHWPDCLGSFLPHATLLKTVIEFSHRVSTALLLPLILLLIVWAFLAFPKGHPARFGALGALGYTIVEALIGAALVHYHLVAQNHSVYRAIVMPIHLVTTFMLLMTLALTAWWSSGGAALRLRGQGAMLAALGVGLLVALVLGVSGAITALGDTLFPSRSLSEGLRQDFLPSAHFLIRLRVYHPLIAMSAGLYLTLIAGLSINLRPSPAVQKFARAMIAVFLLQMGAGMINLSLRAPVWMQLIHLLLADLLWISLVLMTAAALAEGVPHVELSAVGNHPELPPGLIHASRTLTRVPTKWVDGLQSASGAAQQDSGPEIRTPAGPQGASLNPSPRAAATWKDYLALTKPRVISLLLFTTLTAMWIAAAGRSGPGPGFWLYVAVGLGFYMAAGAANAINMVLERDLDLRMGRTARRPTVTQAVPPRAALQFAFALTVGSFALLWGAANLLSAMLALAGLAFYVVIYTLLLKRRTWSNIVIGGAAGAFPPLVGWAAVTGDLSPLAWCLFGIIFLWTPVHFWALAILLKEDYARAGVPMLPVVRGERATVIQIAGYAVLTVAISTLPFVLRGQDGQTLVGSFYLAAAGLLNAVLLLRSWQLLWCPERQQARTLFHYSMLYLALLFLAMAVDRAHWI